MQPAVRILQQALQFHRSCERYRGLEGIARVPPALSPAPDKHGRGKDAADTQDRIQGKSLHVHLQYIINPFYVVHRSSPT